MTRYLLLLVALLAMVVGVQGLSLTFQQPEDFNTQTACMGTTCAWVENSTGGNSYFVTQTANLVSQTALPMTYAAETDWEDTYLTVILYDSSYNIIYSYSNSTVVAGPIRVEMKIIGGVAYIYNNGGLVATSGALAVNPSYVGFGGGNSDDVIWGNTEPKYIFGMPDQGYWTGKQYFLMKDILNPAASGFYRVNTTDPTGAPTLILSNTFTSTFGKGSGTNETVNFESPTGGTQLQYYTGTKYAGLIQWNLTQFFASDAPYGLYTTTIDPQVNSSGFAQGEYIPYIGSGASIQFDKNSYAVGEEATLTVIVSDSYYNTATYAYHVVIMDIYGTEIYDEPISFSALSPYTGIATYTWTDEEDEGVYYGLIYATQRSDDEELLMNYDTADLNSNLIVTGYVFNAENATVISGAMVNVTQGVTTDALTTVADGNYSTTSPFVADAPTTIVASKAGYETYQHVFTPLYAGTIQINLTLMPTNPAYTGIALGGIARTPPYNRTINSARIDIQNVSDGHIYSATTNSVGYYIQNSMAGASHWFDVWGSKTGFSNSTIYQKLVVGS